MMSSQGFDPKDLEEICSRKPSKFKMKKADFKELGRNILLGAVDVAVGSVAAIGLTASALASDDKTKPFIDSDNGWTEGPQGWGNYVNGEKLYSEEDDS
ncbi:putative protein api57 [Erwinia rhapontici]|uniref:hypothetical protein n=1 Tax=Erwinia rhapontici TaxID=55212 RepID=UPI003D35A016